MCLLLVMGGAGAAAQQPTIETELKPIVDQLARTASSQQFSQIIGAARNSPQLARQLGSLVGQGKLTEIRIVTTNGPKPFRAWVDRTTMSFTAEFLKAQLDYRGPTFHAGDILPNNTVYCLGHLAYHLAAGMPDPAKFPRLDDYVRQSLEIEAGGYVQGYNDVMDVALQANNGKPLSERQALPIMMNPWYREALGKAKLTPTGAIELNPQNIALVVESLRNLKVTDLE